MKLERTRANVFVLTATGHELSVLVAGARMALSLMRDDPAVPPDAVAGLNAVLADYDRLRARLGTTGGREQRPPLDDPGEGRPRSG